MSLEQSSSSPPRTVQRAVYALWISIGVTLLLWISNYSVGVMNQQEFFSSLFILALFCLLPYKISQRSNLARQFCIALTLFSLIVLVSGGHEHLTQLEYVVSLLMLPVDLYIIYQLLSRPSAQWFRNRDV